MFIKKIEYKGLDIEIHQDEYPENPRDWGNLGTMWCHHSKYKLGDVGATGIDIDDAINETFISLPLYLYDHSGLSISTEPFSCKWDSGKIGFIYCSLEDAQNSAALSMEDRNKGWDCLISDWRNPKGDKVTLRTMAEEVLKGEVEVYNDYLSGQVYGWVCEGDSCFGYFGSDFEKNGLLHSAKAAADWTLSKRKQMVCKYCGSDNVTHDALARWDQARQEWSLSSVLDNSNCENCGREDCVIKFYPGEKNENT